MIKPKDYIAPPRWSQGLLKHFLKDEYLEEIEGDLEEVFGDLLGKHSVKKSRRLYNIEVFKVLRPILLRRVIHKAKSSHFSLLRHNLLSSIRSFRRYKTSFLTNLAGLTTAMTASLIIFLWISDEKRVDRFHEKDDLLFQVMQNKIRSEGIKTDQGTPALLANALKESLPEIEYSVTTNNRGVRSSGILFSEDNRVEVSGTYASSDFFKLFSYKLINGEAGNVLQNRNQVVLSTSTAIALFGTTENIIGKTVKGNNHLLGEPYYVTGVFADSPYHSTAQFDFVISYKTVLAKIDWLNEWNADGAKTYVSLKAGTDPGLFNQKIQSFLVDKPERKNNELFIQKYSSRYLHGAYSNGKAAGGRITYVRLFSVVAIVILLMACINFINLSTAQASRKMKEVGLKRTLGVKRKTLMVQFMTETLLASFFALLLSVVLVWLLIPTMNVITGKTLQYSIDSHLSLFLIGVSLVTGVISGVYPSLYLSRFKAVTVLKKKTPTSLGDLWIRKGLVTVQFVLSIVFVVTFWIIDQQIQFIQRADLGYDRENVIHFNMGNRAGQPAFLNALSDIPGIEHAGYQSGGSVIGLRGSGSGFSWGDPLIQEDIRFGRPHIGYDFIETLGIELISGRSFSRDFANEETKLIINEAAALVIGIPDIVGKTIMDSDIEKQVIGVVKNFKTQSLYEQVQPTIMRFTPQGSDIMVKISAEAKRETINKIEALYDQFDQEYPFEASFIDDEHQQLYVSEQRIALLSRYFTAIAMIIASLGLFGLIAFTTQQRIKEVGIRKVLGLNTIGVIHLLSVNITKTVIIATLIALPLSYVLADRWLDSFAYHIDLHWLVFVSIGLGTLVITWLTIVLRLFKTANTSPLRYLRHD